MVRSILAVIAGSVTWMLTALGTDAVLMNTFPQWYNGGGRVEDVPVLLLSGFYSLLFSVLGGYVTALIAGRRELQHAFILGVLQLLMGIVATIKFWERAPVWYHLIFLLLLIPANLLGGRLRARQKSRRLVVLTT
ncbi:MAG: hypothetical protein JOZ52_02420 [Acidobacteria bacterium]|nr:hypothetical protein [Acidobacteriota bacterium]